MSIGMHEVAPSDDLDAIVPLLRGAHIHLADALIDVVFLCLASCDIFSTLLDKPVVAEESQTVVLLSLHVDILQV